MKIGKTKIIYVKDTRPDFDRACVQAYDMAIEVFGIDEFGYSNLAALVEFIRSTDCIHVKFLGTWHIGSMGGHEYTYKFEAWIERATSTKKGQRK